MNIGDKIKLLRAERSMTQKDLGTLLDVSVVSIGCWENNSKKPSAEAIATIAQIFCVSTDYLLGVDSQDISLNSEETNLINKYRKLDNYGKKVVNTVCSIEEERTKNNN